MAFQTNVFQTNAFQDGVGPATPASAVRFASNANAPQVVDLYRAAGYAVIFTLATFSPSGSVNASEVTFGTHAANAYEQNATRTVFKAQSTPVVTAQPSIAQFVIGQQTYVDVTPQVFASQVKGSTPAPGVTQIALQQSYVDPQPVITKTAAISPAIASFVIAGQQFYVDVQPQVTRAQPAAPALTGAVPPLVNARPQGIDLSQQGQIFKPLITAQGFIVWNTVGSPQDDPTQLAPWITPAAVHVSITAPSVSQFVTGQQTYIDPTPRLWQPVKGSPVSFATIIKSAPQAIDLTQQALITPSTIGRQSLIVPLRASPQSIDLTQQALLISSTIGRSTLQRIIQAAPQLIDLTQKALFSASVFKPPAITGPTIKQFVGGPAQSDYIFIQPAFQAAIQKGIVVPVGPVMPSVLNMLWYDAVRVLFNNNILTGIPLYVHLLGNTIPAEFVVAQSVAPGQPIPPNRFVILTVQRPAHLMTVTETINTTPFTFG